MWAARLHEPEAPAPIKLCPAGALIPPQHGQENKSPDRYHQEVSRHGHPSMRRSPRASMRGSIWREEPARLGGLLSWRNDCGLDVCGKTHCQGHKPVLKLQPACSVGLAHHEAFGSFS
jgi:hypothetical protein